jgi:predicted alpha/beta superfamily hydrolase
MRSILLGAVVALAGLLACDAQSRPATSPGVHKQVIENTEIQSVPGAGSDGRAYQIYVALPASYADHPERRYPALYFCDGYWDFALVNAFYGNLLYDKVVPEAVLVGFGYQGDKPDFGKLRRWDYTPVADPSPKPDDGPSGHAPEFLTAIERDIIPLVERQYRVDPSYRVLGGSSLGGLFTLYAAIARPGLFQAYIAPSPAAVWANDWLFGYEDAFAKAGGKLRGRLFMTGASDEQPSFLDGIRRFDERLRQRAYPDLAYAFRLVDGERHAGTKAESYNRGVRYALAPLAEKMAKDGGP